MNPKFLEHFSGLFCGNALFLHMVSAQKVTEFLFFYFLFFIVCFHYKCDVSVEMVLSTEKQLDSHSSHLSFLAKYHQ